MRAGRRWARRTRGRRRHWARSRAGRSRSRASPARIAIASLSGSACACVEVEGGVADVLALLRRHLQRAHARGQRRRHRLHADRGGDGRSMRRRHAAMIGADRMRRRRRRERVAMIAATSIPSVPGHACASSASTPTACARRPARASSTGSRAQDADVLCVQETKAQEHQLAGAGLPARRATSAFFRDATTKKGYSGVAIYSKREPDEVRTALGWAPFDEEGRYIEARFGNLSVVSFYIPSGSSGELRQGFKFEVMDWLKPILDQWLASGRDYVLCGDWNIVRSRAGHPELEIQPEELRLPAARARLAQRPVRRRRRWQPRLGRRLPRAACRRPGLHLVEQPRRGARQQRRLAHRLPVRDAVAARPAARLLDPSAAALLRPRPVRRGLRRMTDAAARASAVQGLRPGSSAPSPRPRRWTMLLSASAAACRSCWSPARWPTGCATTASS